MLWTIGFLIKLMKSSEKKHEKHRQLSSMLYAIYRTIHSLQNYYLPLGKLDAYKEAIINSKKSTGAYFHLRFVAKTGEIISGDKRWMMYDNIARIKLWKQQVDTSQTVAKPGLILDYCVCWVWKETVHYYYCQELTRMYQVILWKMIKID